MDLLIKQFKLRYQGKDYGPSSVIYDVEKGLAERLIAGSNGTIESLPEREVTTADAKDAGNKKTARNKDNGDGAGALPSVDPSKTVK